MLGLIFPGQGSQQVGMGDFLFENFQSIQHLFEEASDTLSIDFKKLCFKDPDEKLNLTEYTQPALVLVSYAYFKALNEVNPMKVSAFAGHSIGEYSACLSAGVFSFASALKSVQKRGLWMQEAVPLGEGSMCALLGLENDAIKKVCEWAENQLKITPVSAANFNAPGQVVISGKSQLIDFITKNLNKENWEQIEPGTPPPRRMKAIPLKVSAPFHCSMMKPAEEKMAHLLNEVEFQEASAPIIQNVNAKPTTDSKELRKNLITQVSSPVLWTDCMTQIIEMNIQTFIECGHGQVLSGLAKKINSDIKVHSIQNLEDLKNFEKLK